MGVCKVTMEPGRCVMPEARDAVSAAEEAVAAAAEACAPDRLLVDDVTLVDAEALAVVCSHGRALIYPISWANG